MLFRARANKTGINFEFDINIRQGNIRACLLYDVITILVWLRTGSIPTGINRFRRHTRKTNITSCNFIALEA